jgi:stage II sporulation protein D
MIRQLRICTYSLLTAGMLGCLASPTMNQAPVRTMPVIKVLLIKMKDSVVVQSKTPITIQGLSSNLTRAVFFLHDSLVTVSGQSAHQWDLLPSDSLLECLGGLYRGSIRVTSKGGELQIVNTLDLESYLKGVVKNEIGKLPLEQIEASKAQAIAARTYIMSKKLGLNDYDVVADVGDQVYRGASSESDVSNLAVDQTRGTIVTYDNRPIKAFYCSSSGGITANVTDVWPGSSTDSAYLRNVSVRVLGKNYSASSPHHRWTVAWSGEEIEALIKTNLPALLQNEDVTNLNGQRLYNLRVLERDSSQRIRAMEIGFTRDRYVLSGEKVRRLLRGEKSILYSSLFRLDIKRRDNGLIDSVTAVGSGNGHGVGMCQWSARAMALDGWSAEQILKFFYRGTTLGRAY